MRKWHILACVFGVLAPILVYNWTVLPVYETNASVIFEDKGSSFTQSKNDPLSRYYRHRETYILNRIEEITSRSLAEEVAAVLTSTLVERFVLPDERPPGFEKKKFIAKQIQKAISAAPKGNTDVILITARTHDPHLSQHLANTTATTLRDRNLRIKKREVAGLREFIEGQLQIFKRQLDVAEEKLKDLKQEGNITSLEQESREILTRITGVEVIYNQVKAERKASEQRAATVRKKLSEQQQELVPRIAEVTSSSLEKLQDRLVTLQTQHATLLVRDYAPRHPKMVALNNEIAQIKKNLREAASKLAVDDLGVDPLSQIHSYLRESLSLEIELESLKAKEQDLRGTLERYEAALRTLPAKELGLVNLLRSKSINEKVYLRLMERYEEAKIAEAEKSASVRIIDSAQLPEKPVAPRKTLNLFIGFILALVAGTGLVLFLEYLNPVFRRPEEVEALTNWRVLASIPRAQTSINGEMLTGGSTNGHSAARQSSSHRLFSRRPKIGPGDAYRALRTNISLLRENRKLDTILVTSVCAQEGKSTTIVNIARLFAKSGMRVLAIDADLRRPTLHKLLDAANEPGLSDVLISRFDMMRYFSSHKNGEHDLDLSNSVMSLTVQQLVEGIQSTDTDNLKVLPSGKSHEESGEVISPRLMGWLLEELRGTFDLILIDSPPLLQAPESMVLCSVADGVLLVIEPGKNHQNLVLKARQILDDANVDVIGAVLNGVDLRLLSKSSELYGYYS